MSIRLVEPTDFTILDSLTDGERNGAVNLAQELDMDRSYVNTRLSILAEHDLLDRIGPAQNSGIYQITPLGVAAARHQTLYSTDPDQFESKIHDAAEMITIERPEVIDES
jgi:DNA-binding IclR family transcriptional regulator